jgi:hypothetical protein
MTYPEMSYRDKELFQVAPVPVETVKYFTMQIRSEFGASKWLTITPEEFKKIEHILCGVA